MKAIQIPDRTRASLAPYLPIPYGTLKILGMVLSILLAIASIPAFSLLGLPAKLGGFVAILFLVIFSLILKLVERDIDGTWVTHWATAYWDRNWRGYTLWVYKEGEEYRYHILSVGTDPSHPNARFGGPSRVMVAIPLHWWTDGPTYWVRDTLVPRPYNIRFKHRTFSGAWCVVVGDSFGNRLTLPVEMALELALVQVQDTSALPYKARHFDLANNFLVVCTDWKWQKESGERSYCRFVDSLRTIEDAINMIRATTRFQRSKEGKAIREFLELRYLMIANNESEEDARKRMLKSA